LRALPWGSTDAPEAGVTAGAVWGIIGLLADAMTIGSIAIVITTAKQWAIGIDLHFIIVLTLRLIHTG